MEALSMHISHPVLTLSKTKMETPEQCVKSVQS